MGGAAVCLMAPDELQRISDTVRTHRPGYKLRLPRGQIRLVELEVFDQRSWPIRPQYDLQVAIRVPRQAFSAEWIIREKIRSQYQRHGAKQAVDLQDVENLPSYVGPGKAEPNFDHD
ncbi:uncharacterized protein N7479_001192 [Penicillium vulpinum]|uniref:uncharacterized protein n=1 Tax=Penicillium vulpinum TaxID=29845 RepID=UPI002548E602|nr:uncharacterized protein N7479_001192 [Penicillium vulpinum]KAJ5971274.1 hypothetical protein N7479_001192 [Penicillium vulpinum]